jgi:hypothetical protein
LPGDLGQFPGVEIATGRKFALFIVCKYASEVWPPIAQTNQSDFEHQHFSILFVCSKSILEAHSRPDVLAA